MQETEATAVIWNDYENYHSENIIELLSEAVHFEFAVAFVKTSGINVLKKVIEERFKQGMTARLVVGLDFYQTDPEVLQIILGWKNLFGIKAFVSVTRANCCFHPKIYFFESPTGSKAIVGSANITAGGFHKNWETSILLDIQDRGPLLHVIEVMIGEGDIVPLDRATYLDYKRRHAIARALNLANEREVARLTLPGANTLPVLERVVATLRDDPNDNLAAKAARRAANNEAAKSLLIAFSPEMSRDAASLLTFLQSIRPFFHASILQLHSPTIAKSHVQFTQLMETIKDAVTNDQSPEICWTRISPIISQMPGLGPNWVSEILHAFDTSKFAVMNKASVIGMELAGAAFPNPPTKNKITEKVYGDFCHRAVDVATKLGLRNTSELDAVFGYIYFESNVEDIGDDEE